jgi:beta-glucosidase
LKWFEQPGLRFAVGVEDTFVPQTRIGERSLDEYELTQHYHYWHSDLALARDCGASMVRWGIPWYRVNPAPGTWEWSWLDQVVARFTELGLEPIVDLMHYGTPRWLDNQFLNSGYPEAVAEYAYRVADRYRGQLNVFTPLNEPLINIAFCGEQGYWPPYLTGSDGFVRLLQPIAEGIVRTQQAIVEASGGGASFVHVEASFRYGGDVDGEHADEVRHLRNRAYLVEDLLTGRVGGDHPLAGFLADHGFDDRALDWHRSHLAVPDVMGVNHYPLFATERFEEGVSHRGAPADPRPGINDWTTGLQEVLSSWAERYGRPVFLTETCLTGTVAERIDWLNASVQAVQNLRTQSVPVVGYTWWCLFDMIEWTYRPSTGPVEDYLLPMGLWDLVPDGAGVLTRVRNPVADRYRQLATTAEQNGLSRP